MKNMERHEDHEESLFFMFFMTFMGFMSLFLGTLLDTLEISFDLSPREPQHDRAAVRADR